MIIIGKIKNFMKDSNKKLESDNQEEVKSRKEVDFMSSLRNDSKKHLCKLEILDKVSKNPEIIDKLPYERLVQLNQLYDERIEELEMLINEQKGLKN